jgi:Ser/Thr protein kinase RdoA (MazF antagonist)
MIAKPDEVQRILDSWELGPAYEAIRSSWHDVFKTWKQGNCFYLRISPALRPSLEIAAELEWVQSLGRAGLPVAQALPHPSGELLQICELESGPVTVACFAEAPGRLTEKALDFRAPVMKNWALLLTKLHTHARTFKPVHPTARRPTWDKDPVVKLAVQEAEVSGEAEAPLFLGMVEHFRKAAFTQPLILCHADLHFGNMTIVEEANTLSAFDFDDSCYHFPEHDLAVALVSIRKAAWEEPGRFDAAQLEAVFLENYSGDTAKLEPWCAYRIALTYFWALASARQGVLDEDRLEWLRKSTPWWKAQLREMGQ